MSKLMNLIIDWIGGCVAMLLKTGQTTSYHSGDDGDYEKGIAQRYEVLTTGAYAGTRNIEVAHYAAATISFTVAGSVVADSANGLATFLAGDTVVVKGSTANDGVYTVAVGANAAQFTTVEGLAAEAAGAVVSLYKRTAHSNECVRDLNTCLMWSRNTSTAEKVGEASTGTLIWADVTKVYTIYSAANTISCVPPNIFRITGGAALTQFHVGDLIQNVGFANGVNNTVGFRVTAVTVAGADLDIVVDPINQVLVAEGAVGDSIGLVCRSIFNYAAGANLIGLSGYSDWRPMNGSDAWSIMDHEAPTADPNAAAFPVWANELWVSTTKTTGGGADALTQGVALGGAIFYRPKTGAYPTALVRG